MRGRVTIVKTCEYVLEVDGHTPFECAQKAHARMNSISAQGREMLVTRVPECWIVVCEANGPAWCPSSYTIAQVEGKEPLSTVQLRLEEFNAKGVGI